MDYTPGLIFVGASLALLAIALSMSRFKRRSKADAAIAAMEDAINFVSDKWLYFTRTLVFKDGIPLKERIALFMIPAEEGLKANFSALKDAPSALMMMILVMGIVRSGTHSRADVEKSLGIEIPA